MKKRIVIAVMFAVITAGVFAQSIPGGFVSPQGTATQGRIRSAADDFIRPDSYTGVSFEKWYGMLSFAATDNITTLGYAAKSGGGEEGGGIYIGMFYSGRFWADVTIPNYTEQAVAFAGDFKNVPVYTGAINLGATPYNQIAVLIGVADMGFRLSFRTTYEAFKTDGDARINTTNYKSYETEQGMLSPQIAWSMAKNLTSIGIKPWITFDLDFNRNYTKTAEYSNATGDWVATESIGNSQNYIATEFNIGLGGITIANQNGWRTSADIEYRLRTRSYENEYNYTDSSGNNQIKTFSGTYSGTTLNEPSYNDHRIRPSFSTQWNGEKIRFRAKLDLNLNLTNEESNVMGVKDTSGTLVKNGVSSVTSSFSFNPDFRLAASWQALPVLFVNVGGQIANTMGTSTVESKTYASGDEVINTSTKAVSYTTTGATHAVTFGITLNPTDNMGIEAYGLLNTSSTSNNYRLFEFGSILVSFKF